VCVFFFRENLSRAMQSTVGGERTKEKYTDFSKSKRKKRHTARGSTDLIRIIIRFFCGGNFYLPTSLYVALSFNLSLNTHRSSKLEASEELHKNKNHSSYCHKKKKKKKRRKSRCSWMRLDLE